MQADEADVHFGVAVGSTSIEPVGTHFQVTRHVDEAGNVDNVLVSVFDGKVTVTNKGLSLSTAIDPGMHMGLNNISGASKTRKLLTQEIADHKKDIDDLVPPHP
jgi:ferric-dicitrate binding protein FerR (iron transport regulator)